MVEPTSAVQALKNICRARSVAIVGASSDPSKFGYSLLETLQKGGFSGAIYPVNPKAKTILGLTVYRSITEIPGSIDLALIIIAAPLVPEVLRQAAEKGVREAIVYSTGYREFGFPEREAELLAVARQCGIRLLGPGVQGLAYVPNQLSAMIWPAFTQPGALAVVSQSGSVTTGLAEWATRDGLGISTAINLGLQVDIGDADILDFLGMDENTRAVMMYIEAAKEGRRFIESVGRFAQHKGIAVLKAGRTSAGRRSASSHTGALAGQDEVFSGACRQFGAVRAEDMESLYDAAKALATLPNLKGRRICIASSSGGGNTLSADEADRQGLQLPPLPPALVEEMRQFHLPSNAHLTNPIDLADVNVEYFEQVILAAARYDVADVFVLAFCDPVPGSTELVKRLATSLKGRLAVIYFGGGEVELASSVEIHKLGVPVFPSPERAMRGIAAAIWSAEFRMRYARKHAVN